VLLVIVVSLVTGGLLGVVDLTAGQDEEVRVPLLERGDGGMRERERQRQKLPFKTYKKLPKKS